ncbi:RNA-guided endonuclease IscB [Ktedonobacter racemifer]|uniref:HNH endonuclease n=1 Tax=Ktedonobacter racemifer DSM 44963 TaxID=485913 RepID=D6TIG6_KTERA|nr:RNA-guided endonuclease IscB [Ktedonobacter racemifer]EFH89223.1 HNH endonuclease [Ktedonobacter racemifer DSM 44963]
MSNHVFVVNHNGHPLMPCQPAKARKLLREGRATVMRRSPFTIQLGWECEEHVQEVVLGLDKGSHVTGFSCIGNGQILLSGEIQHRLDVKDKMQERRNNRRHRRKRKWYRPARFLNRASSKRSGRLPLSIKTNIEEVIRVVKHLPLPINAIIIEDVQVDIALLGNPTVQGSHYQDPTRLDENLRIACLMRDGYACQHCGKQKVRLEAHHLIFKGEGGKDTLTNLLTLCEACHKKLHQGKIQLKVAGVSGHLDQVAQRTMQGKSYLYATLGASTSLSTLFGYQTATLRKARELPKAHDADALCLATYETGKLVPYDREHFYKVSFRPRRTRRRYHTLPRKGQGRVRYQVNDELGGLRKGYIVRVKGRYIKQINSIYSNGYVAFARVKGEPNKALPRDCQLLERERTILWEKAS